MKCPCEDCIVLAICLAKTRDSSLIITMLRSRCKLFDEYLGLDSRTLKRLHKLFDIYGHWDNDKGVRIKL